MLSPPENSETVDTKVGKAVNDLKDLGYAFNDAGQLRKIDKSTGKAGSEPFEFEVTQDYAKNQALYEKIADLIPEIVYHYLEQNGLSRTHVPEDIPKEEATFFFSSPAQLNKSKKLLVLIHGSGFVRAGQWARSLIINNSLDHGTQLPYIEKARFEGYDVLVTNTNDNYRIVNGQRKSIPGLNTAISHAVYVWDNYVMKSQPESVAIVAHSYGGTVTLELAKRFPKFFKSHVFAIAFTDSAHFNIPNEVKDVITNTACNWVASEKPLNEEIKTPKGEIHQVSAGHSKHEWTSYAAIDAVFKFLDKKYAEFSMKMANKRIKLDA